MQVELQLLANLGYLYSMAGDLLRSRDSYAAAYGFAHTLKRPQRVAEIAGHLGEALCELGDFVASSSFLEQSSDLAGPDPTRPRALAQLRLGRLYRLMGQSQVAFEFLIIAADICARSQLDELWTLVAAEIAALGKDTRNYSLAIAFYQGILDRLPLGSDLQMEGRIIAALGDACFYDNQLAVARIHYGKAITIFGKTGDKVSDGRTQSGIGAVLSAQGNHSEALGYFKLSLETAMKCGDRKGVEKVFGNVRALRAQLGGDPASQVLRENAVKMLSKAEEA